MCVCACLCVSATEIQIIGLISLNFCTGILLIEGKLVAGFQPHSPTPVLGGGGLNRVCHASAVSTIPLG